MTRLAPLALLLALAACAPPRDSAAFDGSYRLLTIDGEPIPGSADLTIAGQKLSGQGPCNAYWTTNTAPWPEVRLDGIATTRRQCFVEGGEADFLAALRQTTRAEPVKGGLELSGPDHRMRFGVE